MSITIRAEHITEAQSALMEGMTITKENFQEITDANGDFTGSPESGERPWVRITFPSPRRIADIKNIGMLYGQSGDPYCNDMIISMILDGAIIQQQRNANTYGRTDYAPAVTPISQTAQFDEIIIAFVSMSAAGVRMRLDSVFFGNFMTISETSVVNGTITMQTDPSAQTLPISTAVLNISPLYPGDYTFSRGDAMTLEIDGHKCGTWWISEDAERIGGNRWNIRMYDVIGLINEINFEGKAYPVGRQKSQILGDILDGKAHYSNAATDGAMRGIIQAGSCRQALQQWLIASGCSVSTERGYLEIGTPEGFASYQSSGKISISPDASQDVVFIDEVQCRKEKTIILGYDDPPAYFRIFVADVNGNERSDVWSASEWIENGDGVRGYVEIGAQEVSLYRVDDAPSLFFPEDSSTAYVSTERVAPQPRTAHAVAVNDTYLDPVIKTNAAATRVAVTAHSYGVNNSGNIVINGIRYRDNDPVIYSADTGTGSRYPSEIAIERATLITDENVDAVIGRMRDYYGAEKTWSGRFVWRGEKIGDYVTVQTRWTTHTGGIVKKILTLSKTIACAAEVL